MHDPDALCDLGIALNNAGRHAEAADALRKALKLRPDFTDARFNLGTAYAALGRTDEALQCFHAVLERAPRSADTYSNIGAVLQERGEIQAAMEAYERALEIRPDLVEALNNLGTLLEDGKRRGEAMALYRRALAADPRSARAAYNLGLAHLREFEFEEGWRYCEARFHTTPPVTPPRRFAFPELCAADLGRGHTTAIWPEQGIGDQVLYSTLLPELEARGERFVLEADARLVSAYRRTHPRWEVVSDGGFAACDRHIAIGSLPRLLRPDKASFARQPRAVLAADPDRKVSKNGSRLIGISWRSFQPSLRGAQRRRKSAPLAMFLPLSRLPGVQLLDLQYGDTADERAAFAAAGGALVHLDGLDLFSDLEGVLGAIAACDFVVTTSNVTAHFAGALGKETLLVYPGAESPFYYWVAAEDGRCLWYPSVRIVTTPELDTWQKVIDRVLNTSPLAPDRSP
jgi:cytochrome c-type biogenesis protein CcmH/NrfG